MSAELLAQVIAPGPRWLAVVSTAVAVGSIAELLVRKLISPGLAGAAAVVSGALAATVVGYLLFPPILVPSPDSTTFSIVGAVACALYWVLLRLFLRNSHELTPVDYFRLSRALLLCGVVAGALTGLLSCSPFLGVLYCTPLGLLGGLLLAGPYLFVAMLERHRRSKVLSSTQAEKATQQSSGNDKALHE